MRIEEILAPWEFNQSAPPRLILSGELLFEERACRFALLDEPSEATRLVFRLGEDDGSWTATGWGWPSATHDYVEQRVLKALQNEACVRSFPLGSSRELLRVAPNGIGFWRGYHQPAYFGLGRRISNMKSSQTRNWLETLLARPSSDVAFARWFSQLNSNECRQLLFGFQTLEEWRVAEAQLIRLCCCVLQTEAALWNSTARINWNLRASFRGSPAYFLHYYSNFRLKPRLDEWASVLDRYGPLYPDRSRLCLRGWFDQSPILAGGQLEAPTFHEQLEAHFELNEWARNHLPREVRDELEGLSKPT